MNAYSIKINGNNITTVYAKDKAEARKEAIRQLDKPGRREILAKWTLWGQEIELKQ